MSIAKCPYCGSTKLQATSWYYINDPVEDRKHFEDESSTVWCEKCEDAVKYFHLIESEE